MISMPSLAPDILIKNNKTLPLYLRNSGLVVAYSYAPWFNSWANLSQLLLQSEAFNKEVDRLSSCIYIDIYTAC